MLKLAGPLLVAQLTQMLMGVSDTLMAGRLSSTDMAAVAIASSVFFPVMILVQGIIMALPPIVSRLHGAKNHAPIPEAGHQALYIGQALSLLVFIASFYTYEMFTPFNMAADLQRISADYLQYVFIAFPAFCVYQVLRQYSEGLSHTKPSMIIMIVGLIVNIPANYVFIYGELGVPAYGGAGCGIATAIVLVAMMTCNWLYVKTSKKLSFAPFFEYSSKPNFIGIVAHLKIGLPIGFALLFEVTLFSVIALLLSPLGAKIVASHQIALNVSGVLFMVPLSIGLAVTIRIGYLLGENRDSSAKDASYTAVAMGLGFATINALISVLLRYQLAGLYSTETDVINMAADLLLLAAIFQFSDAVQVIGGCILRGYKDTKAMLIITICSYWGVGLTLGYMLAMTDIIVPAMAAAGFWVGIILGLTVAAILLSLRIRFIQKHLPQDGNQSV
ncbi:MATE family efflux transporter [Planctobacterium marinum]